jgi:hypothetical protein
MLPQLLGKADILDTAMMTLCASYLGRMDNDPGLQASAMVMYGKALKELSATVSVPNFVSNNYVLAAVMCLGMSEVSRAGMQF